MADTSPDKAKLARHFAEETDAIASQGAASDCAEQMAALHTSFDAERVRMQDGAANLGAVARPNR